MLRLLNHRMRQDCPAQMTHPEIRYFPILVVIPRLFYGRGFYDLISGIYGLFLELVAYSLVPETGGFLCEIRPGPEMETDGVSVVLLPVATSSVFFGFQSHEHR